MHTLQKTKSEKLMRGILLKKPDLKKHEWLHSLKIYHLDSSTMKINQREIRNFEIKCPKKERNESKLVDSLVIITRHRPVLVGAKFK